MSCSLQFVKQKANCVERIPSSATHDDVIRVFGLLHSHVVDQRVKRGVPAGGMYVPILNAALRDVASHFYFCSSLYLRTHV